MPTYAFTRTREQMRDLVARKLGVKESGQTLPAEEATIIDEGIDLRLKELHALGVLWWRVAGSEASLTTAAGVESVSLSALTDFLFPVSLMLDQNGSRRPVEIVDHATFAARGDAVARGEPDMAFFSGSTLRLSPVPAGAYSLKLTYQAIAKDGETGQPVDVQQGAMRAFAAVVAADLVLDFQVPQDTASVLLSKQPDELKTIRTLAYQRVDSVTTAPEWF